MRKAIFAVVITVIAAAGLVVADYLALFGTQTRTRQDFIELRFRMIDEKTGAPVIDAHVKCFQRNNQNACTQRDSGKLGVISINVPVMKNIESTWLFEKNVKVQATRDPKLQVLFFHQDYASPVETIMIPDLPQLAGKVITVPMPESIRNK